VGGGVTWWDTHLSTMADGLAAIARTGPQGKRFAWDRAQALAAQAHYADLPRLLTERMHAPSDESATASH